MQSPPLVGSIPPCSHWIVEKSQGIQRSSTVFAASHVRNCALGIMRSVCCKLNARTCVFTVLTPGRCLITSSFAPCRCPQSSPPLSSLVISSLRRDHVELIGSQSLTLCHFAPDQRVVRKNLVHDSLGRWHGYLVPLEPIHQHVRLITADVAVIFDVRIGFPPLCPIRPFDRLVVADYPASRTAASAQFHQVTMSAYSSSHTSHLKWPWYACRQLQDA